MQKKLYDDAKIDNVDMVSRLVEEKAEYLVAKDELRAEVAALKLQILETEHRNRRETVERASKQEAKRTKVGFGRVKFYGEAKTLNEIVHLTKTIDSMSLKSEEKAAALEDLCVFAN